MFDRKRCQNEESLKFWEALKVVYAFMVPTIKAKISRPCFSLSLAHAVIKTLEKNGKFLLRGLICFELFEEARVQVSCHVISNFLLTKEICQMLNSQVNYTLFWRENSKLQIFQNFLKSWHEAWICLAIMEKTNFFLF